MARSHSVFKQTDVTRAVKAVQAAGCSAARVLIDRNGKIEIITNSAPAKAEGAGPDRELTEWERTPWSLGSR